jgi:hypothetical protein
MILLTSLYHDANARRRGELLECLRRNVAAERLEEIHVFIEDAMATEVLKSAISNSVGLRYRHQLEKRFSLPTKLKRCYW